MKAPDEMHQSLTPPEHAVQPTGLDISLLLVLARLWWHGGGDDLYMPSAQDLSITARKEVASARPNGPRLHGTLSAPPLVTQSKGLPLADRWHNNVGESVLIPGQFAELHELFCLTFAVPPPEHSIKLPAAQRFAKL